jgi:hypothetical protein
MPRDGSDQYSIPPGTNGVPDTTIESAKYNAFAADLEVDLNHPRPIVAGGTGANNAHDAMIALSGEIAGQFVTNYDTFPFVAGSFYSNSAATSLPVAGYEFIGICYVYDANSMVLDGRIRTAPGTRYFRQKINGTWGAWAQQAGSVADLDAAYVNVAGDTMTGALAISATTASTSPTTGALTVAGGVGVSGAINSGPITMKYGTLRIANGANSGALVFGDGSSNEGLLSFDGTNFSLTGGTNLILNAQLLVTQPYICSGQGGTTGTYYFGNSGTKYLSYDGTNYTLAGGALFAQSEIWSGTSGVGGTYRFGNAGSKYLNYDGTNFNLVGGNLNVSYLVASGQIFVGSPGTTGTLQFGSSATKYLQYDGTNFNLAGGNLNIAGATVTSGQLTLQG